MEMLADAGIWFDICTIRDGKTVTERVKTEGESFLTITLPAFGKDFERSLDQGHVAHDQFSSFRKTGRLPLFLGGFFELVFDRSSGQLLEVPSIDAIRVIRQLTLGMGKINARCSERRERAALRQYLQCETEVEESVRTWSEADQLRFSRISLLCLARLFDSVTKRIERGDMRGRHGPGATADRLRGNAKYTGIAWTTRLEEVLPSSDFLIPNYRHFDLLANVNFCEPGAETPSKVVLVPKTQKTPRVIAEEPTHMQYVQQSLQELIYEEVERDDILSSLIGFLHQEPNQVLARLGSRDGSLATLDLSEASDRVAWKHVRVLLRYHPRLLELVDACRSRKASVPGHGEIPLSKFASMGSALTFPFEAMIFLVIVLMGVEKTLKRPLRRSDIKSLCGQVRVFGDDIICPVSTVDSVISGLETHGYRVNAGKSFWTGKFRESCGKDYYNGEDVSYVKVRVDIPTSLKHALEIKSTVSTRNQLYKAGWWHTCQWIDERIEKVLRKQYPIVRENSPVVGRHSYPFANSGNLELCRKRHILLVKGYVVIAPSPKSPLDDVAALMKFFLKRSTDPYEIGHLKRAGRAKTAYLKLGRFPIGDRGGEWI